MSNWRKTTGPSAKRLPFCAEAMETKSRFFDDRAEHWEETCYPAPVRERLDHLILEFGVRPGERVLDVGTGPGILLPYLRRRIGKSGRICAFDLSFGMIRKAYAKPRAPRDVLARADVHAIPFKGNGFDRVICFAAFPHFGNPERAMREMGRVPRTGGMLIIAHLLSREELAAHHATHAFVARDRLPENHRMKALFLKAGFSPPHIINLPGKYLASAVKHAA